MLPTPGDVHVNVPLTTISIGYFQAATNFGATRAAPLVPVAKQSDRYWQFPKGYWRRDQYQKLAPGTPAKRAEYAVDSTATYFADVWALASDIPDQRRSNADAGLDQDRLATKLLTGLGQIRREKIFAAIALATGWGTDITGVAGVPGGGQVKQWNQSSSTPLEDVAAGKQAVLVATGFEPMHLVMTYPVWVALKNHPEIVDRVKYGQTPNGPAKVTVDAVAALMELEQIIVMKASEDTSIEGQAAVNAFIGGKTALLMYVQDTPAMEMPSALYTFAWTKDQTGQYGGAGPDGQRILRYRRPEEFHADSVEGQMAFDIKRVCTDCGYFFNTIVA